MLGIRGRGRSQGVPKMFRAPMYGAHRALRGHLCDSTAFLLKERLRRVIQKNMEPSGR